MTEKAIRPYPTSCPDPNDPCGGCNCIHLGKPISACPHYTKLMADKSVKSKICFCPPFRFERKKPEDTGGHIPAAYSGVTETAIARGKEILSKLTEEDAKAAEAKKFVPAPPPPAPSPAEISSLPPAPAPPVQAGKPVSLLEAPAPTGIIDLARFYPVPCGRCHQPIPRTGKRGRPPREHELCGGQK
jgi:hypothetical protein